MNKVIFIIKNIYILLLSPLLLSFFIYLFIFGEWEFLVLAREASASNARENFKASPLHSPQSFAALRIKHCSR